MKKKILILSAVILVFMVGIPILLVTLNSTVSFGILILWLYAGCPIFSVAIGAIAGRRLRKLWYFVPIPAALALVICLALIQMDLPTSAFFAGCYLLLGLLAMGVCFLVSFYIRRQDIKIENEIYHRNTKKK